ncbi:hypothetical protein PI124_g5146 [Phytophthora idaei]|nr:hypothetical protein PI125_g5736 [Phytophthora idaei]KAG3250218.1 hypothetical protein PI124_g5146 [Phytophthora idaei]
MLAELGPTSINEEKLTSWSTTTVALGLEWDTVAGTVSIPVEKIDKAGSSTDTRGPAAGLQARARMSPRQSSSRGIVSARCTSVLSASA